MATLDLIMTGFTGTEEIKKMTERSIQSIRDSEGSENFNIIFLESNLESDHKYDVDHQIHPDFPYHCNKYYNIGITYAKSDFTAIVNNDTFFHKNWWTKLHAAMEKHNLDCPGTSIIIRHHLSSCRFNYIATRPCAPHFIAQACQIKFQRRKRPHQ